MKRVLGKGAQRYVRIDEQTGELIPLVQPFATMSLRCHSTLADGTEKVGGIASGWIHKYHQDIYGHDKDQLHLNGKAFKPARYYDKIYDSINPSHYEKIKKSRIDNTQEMTEDHLRARAAITRARKTYKSQI